jgi:hypothetical protein
MDAPMKPKVNEEENGGSPDEELHSKRWKSKVGSIGDDP